MYTFGPLSRCQSSVIGHSICVIGVVGMGRVKGDTRCSNLLTKEGVIDVKSKRDEAVPTGGARSNLPTKEEGKKKAEFCHPSIRPKKQPTPMTWSTPTPDGSTGMGVEETEGWGVMLSKSWISLCGEVGCIL